MQTQDVLRRLKQATSDRIQAPGTDDGLAYANGRVVLGDYCHNCGEDSLSAVVATRRLVPDEPSTDGNEVSLCDDCHDHAYTAEDAETRSAPRYGNCSSSALTVDASVVRDRDDHRCRGCGVRETIVVGDDLHLHPVVPIAGDGFRHPHNYVCLCPTCHRKVHA
jgi:hypothetical protein